MRDLYMLALLPPWPLAQKIDVLRHQLWERFHAQHTLNSPPHITLVPTFQFEQRVVLIEKLQSFSTSRTDLQLQCTGFGHFGEKTIFVSIEPNEALTVFHKEFQDFCRKELNLSLEQSNRPYHPHITLATKDLRKSEFPNAWEWVQTNALRANFIPKGFHLLRHSGKRWLIDEFFGFD